MGWMPNAFRGEGWLGLDWGLWSNLISEFIGIVLSVFILTYALEKWRVVEKNRKWKSARKRTIRTGYRWLERSVYDHIFLVRNFCSGAKDLSAVIQTFGPSEYHHPLPLPKSLEDAWTFYANRYSNSNDGDEIAKWHDSAVLVMRPDDIETVFQFAEYMNGLRLDVSKVFWPLDHKGLLEAHHSAHYNREEFEIYTTMYFDLEHDYEEGPPANIEKTIILAESIIAILRTYVDKTEVHIIPKIDNFSRQHVKYFQRHYNEKSHVIRMITENSDKDFTVRRSENSSSYTYPALRPCTVELQQNCKETIKILEKEIGRLENDLSKLSQDKESSDSIVGKAVHQKNNKKRPISPPEVIRSKIADALRTKKA